MLGGERLAPSPALLPSDATARAHTIGLCHEICGEDGLGWARRLQGVRAGLAGEPGFPKPVAAYLGEKYGYREEDADSLDARVHDLLGMLSQQLRSQQDRGHRFYLGEDLSAVDIYSATFMALFKPLPPEQCAMADALRPAFEAMDEATAKALDPILLEHRDFIYETYLETPLTL